MGQKKPYIIYERPSGILQEQSYLMISASNLKGQLQQGLTPATLGPTLLKKHYPDTQVKKNRNVMKFA